MYFLGLVEKKAIESRGGSMGGARGARPPLRFCCIATVDTLYKNVLGTEEKYSYIV